MAGYFNIVFPQREKEMQFSRITERKCHTISDAESCFCQPLVICGWKGVFLKILLCCFISNACCIYKRKWMWQSNFRGVAIKWQECTCNFWPSPLIAKVSILLVTAGTSVCSPVSSSNFYEIGFLIAAVLSGKNWTICDHKFIVQLTETSTKSSDFYLSRLATTTEMLESSYLRRYVVAKEARVLWCVALSGN